MMKKGWQFLMILLKCTSGFIQYVENWSSLIFKIFLGIKLVKNLLNFTLKKCEIKIYKKIIILV